jgi:alpha-L-fucosidase
MATEQAQRWFQQARFGMFIHWGLYALLERHEWTMYQEDIPAEEYRPLADRFDPQHYDPEEWVALAEDAGVRYLVLTSRHHEGFCLWDSKVSDFTTPKTAARRDLLAEFAAACQKRGMPYGFYYSLLDWRLPAYWKGPQRDPEGWAELREYVHAQVEELCTDYGELAVLWYDGGWPYTAEDWGSAELNARVRTWQPNILINDRSLLPEDFSTPEQHVTPAEPGRLWESCMTMNTTWGYSTIDREWKTSRQLIHFLVTAAAGGGNYLLNVGPDPEGRIPFECVERLRAMGRWMDVYGESIYGSERVEPRPVRIGSVGRMHTVKGNTLYLHCWRWTGREAVLGGMSGTLQSARLLDGGVPVDFEQRGHRVWLRDLPQYAPDPVDTVIALEFDRPPVEHDRFA